MVSDYCYSVEMMRAMERHERGEATVIPIILRPCDWTSAPFSRIQALPKKARPVTSWSNRDKVFSEIVQNIDQVIQNLQNKQKGIPMHTIPFSFNREFDFVRLDGLRR